MRHTAYGQSGPSIPLGPLPLVEARLCAALLVALAALVFCMLATPAHAATGGSEPVEGSAVSDEAEFGINGFTRYQKGAERPVGTQDVGYRFPVAEGASFAVVCTPESVLVYVEPEAAEASGFDAADASDTAELRSLIEGLDEEASRGGALLAEADKPWVFTSEDTYREGTYCYRFFLAIDGRTYCAVEPAQLSPGETPSQAAEAQGLDLGAGALWCDSGALVSASEVVLVDPPTMFEQVQTFLATLDMRPFWVSIKTSAVALVLTFVLGLVAAWRTMGTSSRLKGLLDSVFTIPMVLPPTVCGFLLLLLFGQATPVGRWFIDHGIALVFTWPAAVISAVVVSFPLMYRTALGAFESLDPQMLDAARTLGWSERRIFTRLMMPIAWPSIAAGTVLAFARAMGEFGCTLFFAGNYAGITQTIPIAIYFEWMSGNTDVALFWVAVVILFSFCVILLINLYTARSQRYRARGGMPRRGLMGKRGAAAADVQGDTLEDSGGDALRIDRDALRELMGTSSDAVARAAGSGAPDGAHAGAHEDTSTDAPAQRPSHRNGGA